MDFSGLVLNETSIRKYVRLHMRDGDFQKKPLLDYIKGHQNQEFLSQTIHQEIAQYVMSQGLKFSIARSINPERRRDEERYNHINEQIEQLNILLSDEELQNLKCGNCQGLMQNPITHACGRSECYTCFRQYLSTEKKNNPQTIPNCPYCGQSLLENSLFINLQLEAIYDEKKELSLSRDRFIEQRDQLRQRYNWY